MSRITAISLFSGAGGLDLGFEGAGYEIVFANECDKNAASTWRNNRPQNYIVMHEGDIKDYLQEITSYSNIDIIIGGPPCQGFSAAGKMNENDPRNEYIKLYMDIVKQVMPQVFVLENVGAIANHQKWEKIRQYLKAKAYRLGYSYSFKVHDVSDYGVPERRSRLLFVGVLKHRGNANLFDRELASRKVTPSSLRATLVSVGKFGTDANPNTSPAVTQIAKNPVLRGNAYTGMLFNGSGRPVNLDGLSQTLTASMGGNNTPLIDQVALEQGHGQTWFDELFHMIQSGRDLSNIDVPPYIRRMTICEAAAIQGFPPSYEFSGSNCSQYKQIGNAVPVTFAFHVAEAVKTAYFDNLS